MVRKSEQDLRDDYSSDIVRLLHSEPFYGHILVGIQMTFDPRMQAAAGIQVSTHVLLRINPDLYFREKPEHRVGIIKHEALHAILKHVLRGRHFTNKLKANVAADFAVNPLVGKGNLPTWTIWPEQLDLPDNETFEWYYDNIAEPEIGGKGKSGKGGRGKKQGGKDPQNQGDGDKEQGDQNPYYPEGKRAIDEHDWESAIPEGQEGLAEIVIDRMIRNAERQCGDIPGNIKDLIHYREQHVVPWQTVMRRFFGSTRANLSWTKKRSSRRYDTVPGIRLEEKATVVLGVDSSGSISNEELSMFLTEVDAAHKTGLVDIWTVICDCEITEVIHPFRKIELIKGRGGTDYCPIFNWSLDNSKHPPVDGVVVIGDGCGPVPVHRLKIPVLWVITSDGQFPASYGMRLKLPPLESQQNLRGLRWWGY
jgi:predicted metal-dependent peptidase